MECEANAPAPTYDPLRAKHEAAHAVIIDDLGYQVTWVNVRAGRCNGQQRYQMTKANWAGLDKSLGTTDWSDSAQREAMTPAVLGYVTMLVAGHLAENLDNGAVERVSSKIHNTPWLLGKPPSWENAKSDRDRTALLLYVIQRNTIQEVQAAEQRALEILSRRQEHLKALTELLVAHGTVEGELLAGALGKPGA